MSCTMEWATYRRLLEVAFFERTLQLYQLEKTLKTPIPDSMHWTRRFEYPWVMEKLALRDPESVLDVGSGATALQFLISSSRCRVTSIDPDQSAVDWVNENAKHGRGQNRSIIGGLSPDLPFMNNAFDTVICVSVLEHLPKNLVPFALQELVRVTGNSLILTMDVAFGRNVRQVDEADLCFSLSPMLGCAYAGPPPNALTFNMDGNEFGVACIHLTK